MGAARQRHTRLSSLLRARCSYEPAGAPEVLVAHNGANVWVRKDGAPSDWGGLGDHRRAVGMRSVVGAL